MGGSRRFVIAVGTLVAGVYAQADNLVLEEIMVTAQRTVEGAQTVPLTVNTISGEAFDDLVGGDLRDVAKLTPGLSLESTGNGQNVTLRGVGTKINAAQSPRTNIYVDGAFQMQQQNSFLAQYDLERFEVLRGPQGTLYGKASPTGTIVIHTQNPDTSNIEGYVRQTFAEHDTARTEFGISLPIIEGEMAVRLSGLYDENNVGDIGYSDSAIGDPIDRTSSGRATWVWDPNAYGFDMRFSYTYANRGSSVDIDVAETLDSRWGEQLSPYDRTSLANQEYRTDIEFNQGIYEFNYDFDIFYLTYQTYYAEATNDATGDLDRTPLDSQVQQTDINFSKLFNNEIRLASEGNEVWDWIAGVYTATTGGKTPVEADRRIAVIPDVTTTGLYLPGSILSSVTLKSKAEDYGVFFHNTLFLNDQWTATLGARWTRESRDNEQVVDTNLTLGGFPIAIPGTPNEISTKYIDWTGTAKLAYEISPDALAYVTVDLGGRSGGAPINLAGTIPVEFFTYDPESSLSYEVGYKSTLMGGRLRLNAALYHQTYEDYQVEREVPIIDAAQGLTTFSGIQNAEEVVSSGAEVELTYLFTQGLQGSFSLAYNDTKFEEFTGGLCDDGSHLTGLGVYGTCDLSGQRIGGDSANWSGVAALNYSAPLMNTGFEWYGDVLMNFTSFKIGESSGRRVSGYSSADLFTGVRNDEWDLKLWMKNVFDREALFQNDELETTVPDLSLILTPVLNPLTPTEISSGVIPHRRLLNPRQVGVTLTYRFD